MFATIAWALSAFFAVAFAVSYAREPRRLRNGVLLLIAFLSVLVAVGNTHNRAAEAIVALIATPLLLLAAIGYVALILFLVVNGLVVIRREGRSSALLLPLAVGAALLIVPAFVIWALVWSDDHPGLLIPVLALCVAGASAYAGCVFLSFLIYGVLYRLKTGSPSAGVVLILGSRVIDGRVPPLLAALLDRAVTVFRARESASLAPSVLICCGGQGRDETCAEATAMARYLRAQGIPDEFIVEEEQSTTTRENLEFGRRIADRLRPNEPLLIATNDYHTFRTALLSRDLGLRAQVLAARTARYYVPAAFLREFIAVVRDYLWVHLAMLGLFATFVVFLVWESLQQH